MISNISLIMTVVNASLMAQEIAPPEPLHNGLYIEQDEIIQPGVDLSSWSPDIEEYPWEASGLFEGDIMLSKIEDFRNVILDEDKYWPNATVPYYVSPDQFTKEQRSQIRNAVNEITKSSCVVIREYQPGDNDFVKITGNKTGCWSYVGRRHGGQVINLQPHTCLRTGTVIHEFLHALGFHHQHSSYDRDSYIEIRWENVKPGKESNFSKYNETIVTDFGVGYDYTSVMHYSRKAFSKNRLPTIVPKEENAVIGQRKGLSEKDIKKLRKTYNCN